MPSLIVDEFGRPFPTARERETVAFRSRVDAAQTTDENKKHWANADSLGPNAAFSEGIRMRLRNRGTYEGLNNSYAHGLGRSLSYDLIGTGPRPQIGIPNDKDGAAAKEVETCYAKWARACGLGRKYRMMEWSRVFRGDIFGVVVENRTLRHPLKIDLRLFEAEQCATPPGVAFDPFLIDGIQHDQQWNRTEYYFLRRHPGEVQPFTLVQGAEPYEIIPAENVVHWYEQERPNQVRGIPRITSALPNFSQLRRIRMATLTAMEFASMLAGIMKTNLPPSTGQQVEVSRWDLVELVRGALLTLPEGWEATQFKPEQPAGNFEMMNREVLNESGRGVGCPLNVTIGNSSGYNFSSGRLDHVPYHAGIWIDRDDFELIVAEPVFLHFEFMARAWSMAYPDLPPLVRPDLPPVETWTITWNWDGFGTIDPVKEAQADDIRLKNGTATYADILSKDGKDWQGHMDQLAREKEYAESKDLPFPMLFDAPGATEPAQPDTAEPMDPEGINYAVATAMSEAGIREDIASDILADLAPTIGRMRVRKINGHGFNGHSMAGGRN